MFFTKQWLTSHIEREHQSTHSKSNVLEKSTIFANNRKNNNGNNPGVSAYENHRYVVIGPINVGKTY